MLQDAAQWLGNFFETVAAVALVLLTGALIAVVAFWIFRRTVRLVAGPDHQQDDTEEPPDPGSSI